MGKFNLTEYINLTGLEAKIPRLDKPKLYHLSNVKHDVLKSKAMVYPKSSVTRFDHRISLLLTPITREDLLAYIAKGFKRWDLDPAFLFVINPDDITNYDFAKMESTPQQIEYDNENFERLSRDISDKDFLEWKRGYSQTRDEYLRVFHDIPTKDTIESYLNHPLYQEWNSHDWLEYNLKHGHKDQYASTIPHMQIHINEPIQYEEVIQLR